MSLLVVDPHTSLPLVTSAARIYDFLQRVAVRGEEGRKERERPPCQQQQTQIKPTEGEGREREGRGG